MSQDNEDNPDYNLEDTLLAQGVPKFEAEFMGLHGIPDFDPDEEGATPMLAMAEGKCCTCGSELGKDALILCQHDRVVAAFCGGPCAQDMHVLGWLSEHYDDMVSAIHFRGGNADGGTQS